ncbi:DNA alkylation repair protein [Leptospira ryugenii]|nr:DNA alkylation repair protein [Leptospira ryugenii]
MITFITESLKETYPKLDAKSMVSFITKNGWQGLELKDRIHRICLAFIEFLPKAFEKRNLLLIQYIEKLRQKGVPDFNFPHIYLPEIVSETGVSEFESSMKILEEITVFTSAEFAIRRFYQEDFLGTVQQMKEWAKHKNPYVRRLASEGSRPFLPWGIGIQKIKANPEIHLPILERNWNDSDETVRRSVANHLNDISKLQPDLTKDFCLSRLGISEEGDKILRHALRTLLKRGDREVLSRFLFNTSWKPKDLYFQFKQKSIHIGESISFLIRFQNTSKQKEKIRIEYKIKFLLANGKYGEKVFQIGETTLDPNNSLEKTKSHSFRPITTRVYYPGKHSIHIILNGNQVATGEFYLKAKAKKKGNS